MSDGLVPEPLFRSESLDARRGEWLGSIRLAAPLSHSVGLLEPSEGEVLFGGLDIRKLGLKSYRAMVAAVMQDGQLFAGSIADNISLFAPDAEQAAIEAAAVCAGIHEEIAAMPMGYRSLVGDMGSALSGGQKPRVVLARALYRAPKLLGLAMPTL